LLIKTYPQSTLQDDSQLTIGEIFEEDKKEIPLALLEYNKALEMHDGDQKSFVIKKIRQLQKKDVLPFSPTILKKPKESISFLRRKQGGISIDQSRKLPKSNILSVRYWVTAQWAKIVINTSRPIPYLYGELPSAKKLDHEHKFYIDLVDSQNTTSIIASLNENKHFIHDARLIHLNSRITRLTFTLNGLHSLRVYDYELSQQNVITLEIFSVIPETPPPPNLIISTNLSKPTKPKRRPNSSIQRVVIDPGHGGIDSGARGFGILEKDIVLAIAKELKQTLETTLNLKVFLTRNSDRFLPLESRAALARQYEGDLFISLHVNAHTQADVHGIESYYLDVSDNQTSRKLALRENKMTDRELRNFNMILHDLLSLSHFSQSIRLTKSVHQQLVHNIYQNYKKRPRDLGIKEGPFVVLLGVDIPSTLIEISFVTNFEESRRLKDPYYHKVVANGITQGIKTYIQ